jgi:hypothetical protein
LILHNLRQVGFCLPGELYLPQNDLMPRDCQDAAVRVYFILSKESGNLFSNIGERLLSKIIDGQKVQHFNPVEFS